MTFLAFTDNEATELYRLYRLYYREARKCEKAKAYLAGCIMLGSALETMLMLMVNVYPEEAAQTGRAPRRNQQVKPLRDWKYIELLRVVKAAGWLPSGLDVDKDAWSTRRAGIGDYAEVVRMFRNLVHPARFLADHFRGRVTNKRLEWQYSVVDSCREWLLGHVHKSLLAQMEVEGLLTVKQSREAQGVGGRPQRRCNRPRPASKAAKVSEAGGD